MAECGLLEIVDMRFNIFITNFVCSVCGLLIDLRN